MLEQVRFWATGLAHSQYTKKNKIWSS
jgi:hypothetical protein